MALAYASPQNKMQGEKLDTPDFIRVSFTGRENMATEGVAPPPIMSAPRHIDFDRVDTRSTYSALSSCVKLLREAGRRQSDFVSRAELAMLIQEFEYRKVDLSNVMGFPYAAEDLGDCILLLARLQNRMAMRGIQYSSCTLREIMEDTLLDRSNKNHRYDVGEWIEVRGPSMKYRLERIIEVIRTSDAGEGNQFIYETSVDHKLTEEQIRWPRESLRRIFGMAPWVWRQWACLKLENKLRFQEGKPDDFELLDIKAYAIELWELWTADERNRDFRELYDRVGMSGRNELVNHIMAPFDLMHQVVTDCDGRWDLQDAEASMFTYLSLLGTGFGDAFIVFFLQVSIPIVLFFFYTSPAREDDDIAAGTREMLFAVLIFYAFKLNRDMWTNFNHVVGISENICSRIRSLRRITWDEGNDSFLQGIGYTVDLFMNTGYICLLHLFNIWILYNVSDPFELLGSVIFFEFLFNLDEEIARTSWWDGSKRLLKAGIISTIMQNTIRRSILLDSETYLRKMAFTFTKDELEVVRHRFDESGLPKDRDFLHGVENEEGHLLTVAERVDRLRSIESKATLPDEYTDRQRPGNVYSFFFNSPGLLFERHEDLRAWSQWEILLFSFPTPNFVPPDFIPGSKLMLSDTLADQTPMKNKRLFAPGKSKRELFFQHTMEVLTCRYNYQNFQSGTEKDTNWFLLTRTLHAIALWFSYLLQLSFPFFSIAAVALVFTDWFCTLHLGECNFAEPAIPSRGLDSSL